MSHMSRNLKMAFPDQLRGLFVAISRFLGGLIFPVWNENIHIRQIYRVTHRGGPSALTKPSVNNGGLKNV